MIVFETLIGVVVVGTVLFMVGASANYRRKWEEDE